MIFMNLSKCLLSASKILCFHIYGNIIHVFIFLCFHELWRVYVSVFQNSNESYDNVKHKAIFMLIKTKIRSKIAMLRATFSEILSTLSFIRWICYPFSPLVSLCCLTVCFCFSLAVDSFVFMFIFEMCYWGYFSDKYYSKFRQKIIFI